MTLRGKHAAEIEKIRLAAHYIHTQVNQHYDKIHPYGYHLDMVADIVCQYAHSICRSEEDVLPLMFGAYFHDTIEDARLTYNDVLKIAGGFMNENQTFMATEIVYALTNDKGRTRAERAGERYYKGIRETPYAPMVKTADRLANITYSFSHENDSNHHMKGVYSKELPHFLEAVDVQSDDLRYMVPQEMKDALMKIVNE